MDVPGWQSAGMADTYRSVQLSQMGEGRYKAVNRRGGVLPISSGDDPDFSPVELLLAAIAGCTALDVAHITGKRAEPDSFSLRCSGDKIRDESPSTSPSPRARPVTQPAGCCRAPSSRPATGSARCRARSPSSPR